MMEAVAATAAPGAEAVDATGDDAAFTTLYAPRFEAVYDYVLRVVRDPDLAADVVRETFARARRQLPDTTGLFTTARTCALEALRYRRDRNGADREPLELTRLDSARMPDASVAFDRELAELVWDAAAALPVDDYSLLALSVRHGVPAEAIADRLSLNGSASGRIERMRARFDEQVTIQLLERRARHNCTELDILLAGGDRAGVARHARRCSRCRESKRGFVSPVEVLGALEWVAPAVALRREIFGATRRRRRLFGIL